MPWFRGIGWQIATIKRLIDSVSSRLNFVWMAVFCIILVRDYIQKNIAFSIDSFLFSWLSFRRRLHSNYHSAAV